MSFLVSPSKTSKLHQKYLSDIKRSANSSAITVKWEM